MFKARFRGAIANEFANQLRNKTKEEIIQEYVDTLISTGSEVGKLITRNRAGGIAKADIHHGHLKQIARAIYSQMKKTCGKNPKWNDFIDALNAKHPEETWVSDTVNKWWKSMNAGKRF